MTIVGTVWAARGPSPITDGSQRNNGMVTAIAVNPNNANIIFVGTAGGGVWKTRDAGTTWRPLFDRQSALGIGEPMGIAIDPNDTDTIYVGTSGRGRVSPQRAGRSLQVDRRRRQLGQARSPYPPGNSGNASQFAGAVDQHDHRRPRQLADALPRPRRSVSSDPPTPA